MANRYLFCSQQLAALLGAAAPVVPNPFNADYLRALRNPFLLPSKARLSSSPMASWYHYSHQWVEDAAVNERRARRWPSNFH